MLPSIDLLSDLNPAQREAVTHGDGPLMIVAGAGTGKTMVITRRIGYLVLEKGVPTKNILALTFTDKASGEMEERVDRLLPMGYVDLAISTFHVFCEGVLREYGMHIGLPADFKVATELDAWLVLRRHLADFQLDYFKPRGNPTKFLRPMMLHFSRAKDEGITPDIYAAHIEGMVLKACDGDLAKFDSLPEEVRMDFMKWRELAGAYATYEQTLLNKGYIDFGGLLLYTRNLLRDRPNLRAELTTRYPYVIVDEFQDTNSIQYDIVKLLAGERRNVTVVGDDDQSIYKFRGAALKNILDFRTDFPDAKKVLLTENYRSGSAVLDTSYTLIQNNNPHRLEATEGLKKQLTAALGHEGFVRHLHYTTHEAEVQGVLDEIADLLQAGAGFGDIAILVRANDAALPFLDAFTAARVPFKFLALSGLYTKPAVLDALSCARIVVDRNASPSVYRILSHPTLGLSQNDLAEFVQIAKKRGLSYYSVMELASGESSISLAGKDIIAKFLNDIAGWQEKAKRFTASEVLVHIIRDSGLLGDIVRKPEAESKELIKHLDLLFMRTKRYVQNSPDDHSLRGFLAELDAERESGEGGSVSQDDEAGPDVIQVMTVHGAKGLEFAYVFVVNLIEQRFPSTNRSEQLPLPPGLVVTIPELDEHLSEERRLFYVAMTRAKQGLYLVSAEDYGGARKRKPSRFIAEALGEHAPALAPKLGSFLSEQVIIEGKPKVEKKNTLPARFSFSQLAAFSKCPLQYKYAHLLKIPTPGNSAMSFGQSMHLALQKFLEDIKRLQEAGDVETSVPPLSELLDTYDASFIDEWYESEEAREKRKGEGRQALIELHAEMKAAPPRPYMLEQDFTLKVGGVLVKGRIDRIDHDGEGVEIIDYKTGEPKTKLEWDDKRQLILYALAAEQCFEPPLKVTKVTYHYLIGNVRTSFTPTDAEREKFTNLILDTVKDMEVTTFPAEPDERKCKYCDFRDICPFSAY